MSNIHHRHVKPTLIAAVVAGLLTASAVSANGANGDVFINGNQLTPQQIALLEQATGVALQPGHYLVQNGCVAHLESGNTQCAQQPAQAQYFDEDGDEFDQDIYEDDIEEYAYEAGAADYGYGANVYGNNGYGYDAYGNGGNLYNDGTYTYSYGNNGYSYQGSAAAGGYGYYNNDGSSFHRSSNYAGGYSVGQDSNGCIYTPNWSNC